MYREIKNNSQGIYRFIKVQGTKNGEKSLEVYIPGQ